MQIEGSRILVLGGAGLVGTAVCSRLLAHRPTALFVHSRRAEKADATCRELAGENSGTELQALSGDLFATTGEAPRSAAIRESVGPLSASSLQQSHLHHLLTGAQPDIVIDCVNTATAIAYQNVFQKVSSIAGQLAGDGLSPEDVADLLEALYIPRLIRHVQVMYRSMVEVGTRAYLKIGTTGTGGMGLNIPYTHSEERPSRMLLSKSAVAGAHSALLFLMARTPGAPITKEIKPAAAIAWKRIAHGPVERRGQVVYRVDARPRPLGYILSTEDPAAATMRDEPLEAAYIDTGENGLYALEEFAALTTAQQMEFVTPEEIAAYVVAEIEGGNTGHDIINALDNAVLGPSYRAGLMRHWALEHLQELEREHGTFSVAFEMLGPPRVSKLLFEAHLLRAAYGTMPAARDATAGNMAAKLDELVRSQPDLANDIVAVGIPILLSSGEIIRGPRIIVPADARDEPVTPEKLEAWVRDGWVDLRPANCETWIQRLRRIHDEVERIPEDETSSRHVRNHRFWSDSAEIQPGKLVGWIMTEEEHGARVKD